MEKNENQSNDRYILITQCLQKYFLLNTDCKLCIEEEKRNILFFGETNEKDPKKDL